ALDCSAPEKQALVSPHDMFLWVESQRIRLAYAHDPLFAVSLSGVRGLPHQIEAVYRWMLPQPRLRFVLADDPGAGKTIMAGLLLKELRLRGAVERCLILCPAPLTTQWQDELLEKFDEHFEIVSSDQVRYQVGRNPWQRFDQVIASIDFAKQDGVREDLLRAEWDLVIVDEAHKASARTKTDDSVEKTKRYVVVEGVSRQSERLLLLTATPHSGDQDRFTRFLGLLDPDQFATAELVRKQLGAPDNPYFLRRLKEELRDERGEPLFVPRHVRTQPFLLSPAELQLYREVTAYVNRFLGQTSGSRGNAVGLARTVLQRRLASSIGAIHSSLVKRADRLAELADELQRLKPAERERRLAALGRLPAGADIDDVESGSEDVDERTDEYLATQVSAAAGIDQLRDKLAATHSWTAAATSAAATPRSVSRAAAVSGPEKLRRCPRTATGSGAAAGSPSAASRSRWGPAGKGSPRRTPARSMNCPAYRSSDAARDSTIQRAEANGSSGPSPARRVRRARSSSVVPPDACRTTTSSTSRHKAAAAPSASVPPGAADHSPAQIWPS
ncbi:MAG: DEAD/DEAH box helicase, partial [Limnochordales bacterium]